MATKIDNMAPPPNNPNVQYQQNPNYRPRNDDEPSKACLYVLAFFIPFVAVGIKRGACSSEMWLCLLLSYFFYIPGVIYAIYIIQQDTDKARAQDVEMMGQGYATHHQQQPQPIQPHNNQPLYQQQAYPTGTEGAYTQAAPAKHEPAPMAQPPVNQASAAANQVRSDIAPQAPPPTYAEGPAMPVNEKAQYIPPN
ncbi:hypothetical protein CJU90_6390 [Yarrowia sp. C11]|nr:hypothetical protein CJU90_6390 [Yarrowia sp. C11]KAG5371090.1 hypothetical protein CKK34_1230 [Yarrowia sp. E02]